MRTLAMLPLALPLALALASRQHEPEDNFFPLSGGHRWTYQVNTEMDDGSAERESLTLRTLGRENSAWRRRSDDGLDYWLKADPSGIYRVASKNDLEAEPRADKPARYVLKAPYAVGTQWQSGTVPYLLMRRNEFPRELRHKHPDVPMTYLIEGVGANVDTPAGHFSDCLRVRGTASIKVYADPASGWKDMPLTTLEWYCPGVGLVRLERREPANTPFLTGGTRILALESWD